MAESEIRQVWQYHLVKLISKAVCLAPAGCGRLLGGFLGIVFWVVTPVWRKRMAVDQVKMCLGVSESEAFAIAKKSVTKYGPMIIEVLSFPLLTKRNIDKKVVFNKREKFDALFAEQKGVLLATAHFGNWELSGASVALYGYPVVAVARRQNNRAMDKFINEYREMSGAHVTYRTGVLEIARMLAEKYAIGLLADQDGGPDGVIVDFFGRPTSCPKGPCALSRLKGAPVALTLLHSKADGTHEIFVGDKIEVRRTKDREEDIREATQRLMAQLEAAIRQNPEMWFWLHNRWKVDKNLYK